MATRDNTWTDLQLRAADEAGYGRTSGNWSSDQLARIQEAIDDAVNHIVNAWDWQFLHPWTTLTLWPSTTGTASGDPDGGTTLTATTSVFYSSMVGRTITMTTSGNTYTIASYTSGTAVEVTSAFSGETSGDTFTVAAQGDYALPSTFGSMRGEQITLESSTISYGALHKVAPSQIERERAMDPTNSGIPRCWSTRWRIETASAAQVQELMIFPTPDASYTAKYQYEYLIAQLVSDKYPPGGPMLADLWMKGVLAYVELNLNDGGNGMRMQSFQQALQMALQREKRELRANHGSYSQGDREFVPPRVPYTTVNGVRY